MVESGQAQLVERLVREGVIKSESVRMTMLRVDRGDFADDDARDAYIDAPLRIGCQQTMSAPHMHAMALELLADRLVPGARVLDVGLGSGYMVAAMGYMVGAHRGQGEIFAIDRWPQLVKKSEATLLAKYPELMKSGRVTLGVGDGWDGHPAAAIRKFDAIHVGATADEHAPSALRKSLSHSGKMFIPIKEGEKVNGDGQSSLSRRPWVPEYIHIITPITDEKYNQVQFVQLIKGLP